MTESYKEPDFDSQPNPEENSSEAFSESQKKTKKELEEEEYYAKLRGYLAGIPKIESAAEIRKRKKAENQGLSKEEKKRKFTEEQEVHEGWMIAKDVAANLGLSRSEDAQKIAFEFRADHPEWFKKLPRSATFLEHFSPELIEEIRRIKIEQDAARAKEKKVKQIEASRRVPFSFLEEKLLTHAFRPSEKRIEGFLVKAKRRYFQDITLKVVKGKKTEILTSELVDTILRDFEFEEPPQGWMATSKIAKRFNKSKETLRRMANEELERCQTYRGGKYCNPDFIKDLERLYKIGNKEKSDQENNLKGQFVDFVAEISEAKSLEAQEFNRLIEIFGGSKVVDLLYQFRPEFKGLPIEYIKSVIADYLGDFLIVRHGFRKDSVDIPLEYLRNPELREGLLEIMKVSCLEYYHQQKRIDHSEDDQVIIQRYIEELRGSAQDSSDATLISVIEELEVYYEAVIDLQRPRQMVNTIKEGREFPDLNQRINIKELSDKKKILIADEMGLGKSASVIMAKEMLEVERALILAPSNVIDTWETYLDSYFKEAKKPSVLIVKSIEDLQENLARYEYIVMSQERLTDEYTQALLKADFDMVIVDEVHKLKNIEEGIRAQNLTKLAERIQGDDKYLAILSGTPVPNKIKDVAMILRLLAPDQFEAISDRELVASIIKGDAIGLRNILIPRMQMKRLRESVEMPQYIEHPPIMIETSSAEREMYEILIEQDELTASQKIQLLRQFTLNPDLVQPTPAIEGSKFAALQQMLQKDFQEYDRIVVFVNNFVEGILHGERALVNRLALPDDVEIMIIEGAVSQSTRERIQKELNTSSKKILLAVSGQTADVGVDFSGGELVYFYNESWSKYDMQQQLARVYRPGLKHDLESRTFITKNTIEEGIHRYIEIKQRSIEKVLHGIPLQELEQQILKAAEKEDAGDPEVNPELAEHYRTLQDKLLRLFAQSKGVGQKKFAEYTKEHGDTYAQAYQEMGSRSYQANGGRVVATLIDRMIQESEEDAEEIRILDIASGPETLRRHAKDIYQSKIVSMDFNPAHFRGKGDNRVVGGFANLPFQDRSVNYANLSFALHYSGFDIKKEEFERVGVLLEMNRVLKIGGRATINLMYSLKLESEDKFNAAIEKLGFSIVKDYSGQITGPHYRSNLITLEKIRDVRFDLRETREVLGKSIGGLELLKDSGRVGDTRKILKEFKLGDKDFDVGFNKEDERILQEQDSVLDEGKYLKDRWKEIKDIPMAALAERKFTRFFNGKDFLLYKKLRMNNGMVVIK